MSIEFDFLTTIQKAMSIAADYLVPTRAMADAAVRFFSWLYERA